MNINSILQNYFSDFKKEFIDNDFEKYKPGVVYQSGLYVHPHYVADTYSLLFIILKKYYKDDNISFSNLQLLGQEYTDLSNTLDAIEFILMHTLKDIDKINNVLSSILFIIKNTGISKISGQIYDTSNINLGNGQEKCTLDNIPYECFKIHNNKTLYEHLNFLNNMWIIMSSNDSICNTWYYEKSHIPALFLSKNNKKRFFAKKTYASPLTVSKHPLYNEFEDIILTYDYIPEFHGSYATYSIYDLKLNMNSDGKTLFIDDNNIHTGSILLDDLIKFKYLLNNMEIHLKFDKITVPIYKKLKLLTTDFNNVHLSGNIILKENDTL